MYRDMTFIDDIIEEYLEQLITFLVQKMNKNEIFNLGNDTPIKISDLLHKLNKNWQKSINQGKKYRK